MAAVTGSVVVKWVAAGAGVLVLGAAAFAVLVAVNDDEEEPGSPDTTATPPPGETVTPAPTSRSTPSSVEMEEAPGAVMVRIVAAGQPIDDEVAVVLVDVGTGSAEVITLAESVGHATSAVLFEKTDRWVVFTASVGFGFDRILYDRVSGGAWSIPDINVLDATDSRLAIVANSGSEVVQVVNDQFDVLGQHEAPGVVGGTNFGPGAMLSPDGNRLFYSSLGSDSRSAQAWVFDVATGESTPLPSPPEPEGFELYVVAAVDRPPTEDSFFVRFVYAPLSNDGLYSYKTREFSWDGTPAGPVIEGPVVDVSPDGRSGLVHEAIAIDECGGPGQCTIWTALRLVDLRSGESVFRLKGATASSSGTSQALWFADGASFIATVGGDPTQSADPGERERYGFLEVGLDASIDRQSYECSAFFCRMFPSPYSRDAMAYGHTAFEVGGTRVELDVAQTPQQDTVPWGPDPGVFRLIVPVIGRDGGGGVLLPNPVLEFPPFDNEIRLRAAFLDGGCLNVREAAGVENASLACVPEGEVVVAEPGRVESRWPGDPPLMLFMNGDAEGSAWMHVRTATGIEGWVAADYLDWAP